jgi:hypothetical protein
MRVYQKMSSGQHLISQGAGHDFMRELANAQELTKRYSFRVYEATQVEYLERHPSQFGMYLQSIYRDTSHENTMKVSICMSCVLKY